MKQDIKTPGISNGNTPFLEVAAFVVLSVIGVLGLGYVTNVSVNRSEVNDCLTWQQEASQYPKFYLVQWQADQCAAHNITINAPVK